MTTAITFLGNELSGERFRAALPPGSNVVTLTLKGTDAYSGLAQRYPTLLDFMAEYAPAWTPGEPLVLMSFSAGTWALRHYMKEEAARRVTTALVVMDGLYGGVPCNLSPFSGIVDYVKEANAAPSRKRAIITYSLETPAPAACTQAIEDIAGGPGLFIAETHAGSHSSQLTDVGPSAVSQFITPWLRAGSDKRSSGIGKVLFGAALTFVGYKLYRWWT